MLALPGERLDTCGVRDEFMRRPSLRSLSPLYIKATGTRRRLIVSALTFFTCSCLVYLSLLSCEDTTPGDLLEIAIDGHAETISANPAFDASFDEAIAPTIAQSSPQQPNEELCEAKRNHAHSLQDVEWLPVEDTIKDYELRGWEDKWIAEGVLELPTDPIEAPKVDVVYTYVEDSDAFKAMKKTYDEKYGNLQDWKWRTGQDRRFRSWDELRYSIRATIKFGASWLSRLHIVVKDFDQLDPETQMTTTIVQRPSWLNQTMVDEEDSLIQVTPESSILHSGECGQTFNSVSVEAALSNVPLISKYFIAFSDDMFFGRTVSSSDYVSPLYGVSISTYHDIWALDESNAPDLNDGQTGEGHPARFTSFLLNKRFGARPRRLTIHMPKIIDKVILDEAMRTFPRPAKLTVLSRYRDDSQQLYTWLLHASFAVEMHREALLWSIAMSVDTDGDGSLDTFERQALLDRIDTGINNPQRGDRSAIVTDGANENLAAAGLEPLAIQEFDWSSMDGPLAIRELTMEQCSESFSVDTCLGPDFNTTSEAYTITTLFDRLSDADLPVACGDCIIKYLLQNSANGLSPLLPTKENPTYRNSAIKAIHKYSYTMTSPSNSFRMVRFLPDAQKLPALANEMPGLLCINDDIMLSNPNTLHEIGNYYKSFFESAFPDATEYENRPPEESVPIPTEDETRPTKESQ